MELRPYQLGAIRSARQEFAAGNLRQVIYSPTGSGKTEIGFEFIRGALAKGKRVAFVANRIALVGQASRRLHQAGIDHGVIQGENSRALHSPVLVCSIQTVATRGMPPVDLVIIDEAHACPGSKDYRRLIALNGNLPVIGLTATPFARGMAAGQAEIGGEPLFQTLVVAATIRELIDLGYLVDVEIYAPADPDLTGVKTKRNAFCEIDYADTGLGKAMDKPGLVGDIVEHWRKLADGLPTVCFAASIAHSKHIVERFNAAGITAEHIDCYHDADERQAILGRVLSGKTMVISNYGILAEGWDFPACSAMILARPTKSLTRWIQMVGRILRPYPGKTSGIVLDHSGSAVHLGYPTDDLPLELDDGKTGAPKQPRKVEPALPKKCPKCSFMKAPKVHACPKCGFAPQAQVGIVQSDGSLELVKRGKASGLEKQAVYSQLLAIARKRGYLGGWVSNQYREYFGCWPRGMQDVPAEPSLEVSNWVKSRMIRFAKGRKHAA